MSTWVKDPADIVAFTFDWSLFLAPGETIASHTTTVDGNATKVSDSATTTQVSVEVSGGISGNVSLVTCQVITTATNKYNTEKYVTIVTRIS
jgi:hypothetical protein